MKIISIDPGLTGSICSSKIENEQLIPITQINMPTIRVETKRKREVQDLKDGKKQYIKSGPNKGQLKMKMKSAAKYKSVLDIKNIHKLFSFLEPEDHIIIEIQNPRPGNSASSSFTTGINYGKLLALAELSDAKLSFVAPGVWKKHFSLDLKPSEKKLLTNTQYKQMSIDKAYQLSDIRTKKDGIADAICIAYWFYETKTN